MMMIAPAEATVGAPAEAPAPAEAAAPEPEPVVVVKGVTLSALFNIGEDLKSDGLQPILKNEVGTPVVGERKRQSLAIQEMIKVKKSRTDYSGLLTNADVENISEYTMKCVILEVLPTMQEVQHENALAALLNPLVAQIAALTTSVTELRTQQVAMQTQLTTVSNQQVAMQTQQGALRALIVNSLAENMDDDLIVPAMNNNAPPAFMPTTVGDLFNLQAGANMIAIENYFGLHHTGNTAFRVNRLRKS